MAKAKKVGRRGRTPDASSKSGRIRALLATGKSANEIAAEVGCTPALVYNVKSAMRGKSGGAASGRRGRPASAKPGRGGGNAQNGALGGLDMLLQSVRNAERERTHLRQVSERIQSVISDVLN